MHSSKNNISYKAYELLPTGIIKFSDTKTFHIEYANETFYKLADIGGHSFSGNFFDVVLSDDTEYVRHSITRKKTDTIGTIEFRLRQTKTSFRWVRMKVFSDDENYLWALIADNSQEHELMSQLNDERMRYRFAIGCTTNTIYEYSFEKDMCVFYETSHVPSETAEPNIIKMVIHNYSTAILDDGVIFPDDTSKMLRICSGEQFDDFQIRQTKPWLEDSGFEWYQVSGHLVCDTKGNPKKVIGTFTNINKQKLKELELLSSSQRDTVSKLYNYSTTIRLINERMSSNDDGFLVLIDIDNFKRINNTYGHLYGDIVISMISDSIRLSLKASDEDIAGRIGGDEFVVFINGSDRDDIENRVKNMFESVSALRLNTDTSSAETALSCSVGIARRTADTPYYETLFSYADRALFAAKKNGGAAFSFFVDVKDSVKPNDAGYLNLSENEKASSDSIDIVAACFEILERTPNIKNAVNILLRHVSTSLDLDRISVCEKNIVYDEQFICERGTSERLSPSDIALIDGLCTEPVSVIGDSIINRTELAHSGCKLLFIRLEDSAGYYGCMILQNRRMYNDEDINTMREIGRVLSIHLGRNKAVSDAEQRFAQLINYDALTSLPTLKQMHETMNDYMSKNPTHNILIVYSDFYHFRNMNQLYGFEEGDRVLLEFSKYISENHTDNFLVCARISGDEFASAFPFTGTNHLELIAQVNDEFCRKMNKKYPQANIILRTGAYILHPGEQFISALDKADMARKSLDNLITSRCAYFDEMMSSRISLEAEMSRTMRDAVKNREFIVYFQPKVSLDTYKIVGAEALVRWIRPDGTIMGPNAFIPYFERNGFITDVDFCIYEQVMEFLHEWNLNGIKNVPISVNMSRLHGREIDVAARIKFLMDKYSISPDVIEFEVTETALASCDDGLKKCINTLHDMGILINIDDFGSGYSSLNLLTEFPADIIKLDRMMISESITSQKKAEIIRHTVMMAHAIGCDVVCEGVETYQEVEFLRSIGCKMVQGYYFSKPVEARTFRQMLIEDKPLK